MKIQWLTFYLNEQLYGIALEQVKEVVRAAWVTKLHESKPYFKGVIDVHGKLIPVIDLQYLMGDEAREILSTDRFLIIESKDVSVVMVVDRIGEVLTVAADDMITDPLQFSNIAATNNGDNIPLAYSGLLNSDEKITILLDLAGLLRADWLPDFWAMTKETEEGGAE